MAVWPRIFRLPLYGAQVARRAGDNPGSELSTEYWSVVDEVDERGERRVVTGVAVVPQLGEELLPEFKERDFLMHWVTQPGTSHEEMCRITV